MNEIKCPNCGTVFKIDENEYQSIVKQIRDKEFEKEITLRDKQHELDKENSIKLHEAELEKEYTEKLNEKNSEIKDLKNRLDNNSLEIKSKLDKDYTERLTDKDKEITELKNKISLMKAHEELNLKNAVSEKEKEIDNLNNKLEIGKNEFLLNWGKSDDELKAVFTVAEALRELRKNNISSKIFDSGLGISLFRDNSTRTRFSFASACNFSNDFFCFLTHFWYSFSCSFAIFTLLRYSAYSGEFLLYLVFPPLIPKLEVFL